ncbi:hypothetical protein FSY59_25995 [Comamonas sp. Z3]|nr:hypothetical protein FSY59_25995 [Comamonas sp. Z3]
MVWSMLDGSDDFRRPCTIGVQCPQSRLARYVLAVDSRPTRACRARLFAKWQGFAGGWQLADRRRRHLDEITSIHVPEKRK